MWQCAPFGFESPWPRPRHPCTVSAHPMGHSCTLEASIQAIEGRFVELDQVHLVEIEPFARSLPQGFRADHLKGMGNAVAPQPQHAKSHARGEALRPLRFECVKPSFAHKGFRGLRAKVFAVRFQHAPALIVALHPCILILSQRAWKPSAPRDSFPVFIRNGRRHSGPTCIG